MVAPYFLAPPLLTANGQVKDVLIIQLVGVACFLPMLWVASKISLEAVAVSGVAATVVRITLLQRGLSRGFKLGAGQLARAALPSVGAIAGAFLVSSPLLFWYERTNVNAFLTLAAGGLVTLAVACAGMFFLKHPLAGELARLLHPWFPATAGVLRRRVD
jgi:hypothetical protein